jgi:hypothetical protein
MTSFDVKVVRIGVLLEPEFFEGSAAWVPRSPLASSPAVLVENWTERFLPVLEPSFPPGFEFACGQWLSEIARRPDGRRRDACVVAESRWPAGSLMIGPYRALIGLLLSALEERYPETKPVEYCTSVFVHPDDQDGLSYLHKPPSDDDIAAARRELAGVERLAEFLDRSRAWALFVGDPYDAWSRDSALTELRQAGPRPIDPEFDDLMAALRASLEDESP